MEKPQTPVKNLQSDPHCLLSRASRQALETLIQLDVPAKGRIAHHIRTGRLQRALELCEAGKSNIWKRLTSDAREIFTQKLLWNRLHLLLSNAQLTAERYSG